MTCLPFLYELLVVLAQNGLSLLSEVSTKLIQWAQIANATIKGEREVLDLFPFWILPSRLPNRIFPVVQGSISCVYTIWTICWFLLSHLSRKLQGSPQHELPTVYKN